MMRDVVMLFMSVVGAFALNTTVLTSVWAAVDPVTFESDPALDQRYTSLTQTLRCPKCQNQSIGGSDAPIATDMRRKVEDMLRDGQTNKEIEDYMIQRYGDYVTYNPPLKSRTYVLWFGPPVFLFVIAVSFWLAFFRRRSPKPTKSLKDEV